ncbi:MAG TPA: hypothetical protein VFK05_04990, partial [Polyangiaceae bacterium]|nr:hypothetical protein [Polyangiaceae bacterium]
AADPPAALRLKRPEVPIEVESIVLKCLEKDPAKRFQTARELVLALAPWAGHTQSAALGDSTMRSSPPQHGLELDELRSGSTVALSSSSDPGTLASAVFTRSGPRLIGSRAASVSKDAATFADAPLSPRSAALAAGQGPRWRAKVVLGIGGALLLSVAYYAARDPRPPAPKPLSAAQSAPSVAPPAPVSTPAPAAPSFAFTLRIASNPIGAEVFEADRLLGATPIQVSIDNASVAQAPRTFSVRKAGYLPYTIVQGASTKDTQVLAELAADPALAPRRSPGKKPAVTSAPSSGAKSDSDIFMQR